MKLPAVIARVGNALLRKAGLVQSGLSAVYGWGGNWFGMIRESFAGAWQQNVTLDAPRQILAFSAVFSCVTGIASDVAKCRVKFIKYLAVEKIWEEVVAGTDVVSVLLRKPNRFQTRIKFIEQWIVSKLLNGNTYVLKERNAQRKVVALYILNPTLVRVLVAENGDIFYQLNTDHLAGLEKEVVVPATEIIHDMMVSLWHPLIGVSPIYACAMSATMANKIQNNSTAFFANASRPSGVLTAPGAIGDETAGRLKAAWETNFQGANIGRLAVLGDGLKYEAMTINATDAQLIEQLKWTVEDVARCFHYPLYKLGIAASAAPQGVESMNQMYYSDCLQSLFESIEALLDEGLELKEDEGTELDLDNLLRMDSVTRYERHNKAIAGGWFAPNEARRVENMRPAKGGDSPMMQQQNWTLAQLDKREAPKDASSVAPPPAAPAPALTGSEEENEDDEEKSLDHVALAGAFIAGLLEEEPDTETVS